MDVTNRSVGEPDGDPNRRRPNEASVEQVASDAADIHQRAGTRAATAEEIAAFHERYGPFEVDDEG